MFVHFDDWLPLSPFEFHDAPQRCALMQGLHRGTDSFSTVEIPKKANKPAWQQDAKSEDKTKQTQCRNILHWIQIFLITSASVQVMAVEM